MAAKSTGGGAKPDIATVVGLVCALVGIVGGLLLEGGELRDILQVTAAIIVMGGTLGATLINCPLGVFLGAMKRLAAVFLVRTVAVQGIADKLVEYATKARKQGIVALEQDAEKEADPFLKTALTLAVDGTDIQEIRKMLEIDMEMADHRAEAEAKVFEVAGGYAPTIGIIGAVMGLIQVMKNLSDIDKVGHGIAVSFVATVYGVGVANIFFLPVANKIKARAQDEMRLREMILEGTVSIVEGMNPKLIRSKLEPYLPHDTGKKNSKPVEAKK